MQRLRWAVPQVQEIVFKNFYTAFLSVRVQRPGPGGSRRWVTCLRDYCLMPCPHTEEGSQDYFSLHRHQVRTAGTSLVLLGLTLLCLNPRTWSPGACADAPAMPCLSYPCQPLSARSPCWSSPCHALPSHPP